MKLVRIFPTLLRNKKIFIKNLSCPAIKLHEDFPEEDNITFILDHGYVCPICKDTGVVPCKLCKNGCVFCGYSKFITCKCKLNLPEIK